MLRESHVSNTMSVQAPVCEITMYSQPSKFDQNRLHCEVTLPLHKAWELVWVNLWSMISYLPIGESMSETAVAHTLPFLPSTQGRLILVMNVTSGGTSG
jgi:hypothetical protein